MSKTYRYFQFAYRRTTDYYLLLININILFKEPADDISEELTSFKKDIIENKSLYPISYNSLQLLRKHVEAFLKEFVLVQTVK